VIPSAGTRLVAARELRERGRSNAFQIGSLVLLVIVALLAIIPSVISGGGASVRTLGYVPGAETQAIAERARALGRGSDDVVLRLQRRSSAADARAGVRSGDLDLALLDPGTVLADDPPGDTVRGYLAVARRDVAVDGALRGAGVPADRRAEVVATGPARIVLLDPSRADRPEQRNLALAALMLLYMAVLVYGLWVATGIVEEKASRVVEVLLPALRPRELLAGKLLGIGLLGLGQLLTVVVVGVGLAVATGSIDLPPSTPETVALLFAWFVLGYALYAALFALSGALVSRQEDLTAATTPLTLVLVLGLLLSIQVIASPDGVLAQVAGIFPLTAPIVQPVRAALGALPLWDLLLSATLTIATTVGVVLVAARVYRTTLLRTSTVGLGTALRGAFGRD
jgi:ABC-2 type transport system permease protein